MSEIYVKFKCTSEEGDAVTVGERSLKMARKQHLFVLLAKKKFDMELHLK